MKKAKYAISYTLLIFMSALILIGAALTLYFINVLDRHELLAVDIEKAGDTDTVTFTSLDIVPGESREYVVLLNLSDVGEYDLRIDFSRAAENEFEKYLYVKIELEGEIICDKLMSSFMRTGAELEIDDSVDGEQQYELKVTYYLPSDVSNEAQVATADFDLTVTATNATGFDE